MRKALLILTIVAFIFGNKLDAQSILVEQIEYSKDSIPNLIVFNTDEAKFNHSDGKNVIKEYLKLSDDDSFKTIKLFMDNLGYLHERLQHYYKGLEVEFSQYDVHSKKDQITSISGTIKRIKFLDIIPNITEIEALNFALKAIDAESYMWENNEMESLLKEEKNDITTYYPKGELIIWADWNSNKVLLAYKFNIVSRIPFDQNYVYINAHNGDLIDIQPSMVNATGTAATKYCGIQNIITYYDGNKYILYDNGRNIETLNMQECTNYGSSVVFWDLDNYWSYNEFHNEDMDDAALDAHYSAIKTYDYFNQPFLNRDGWDGDNSLLTLYVHYDINWSNGKWDGNNDCIALGDGDGGTYYDPWTDLDVVAHEYSHGIYQDEVGNNYNGEPGTIQEALSDIWAACVENYVSLPNHDPWVMFDGFEKTGVHRRSLADPSSNQYHYHPTPYSSGVHYPDVYLGDYWYTGTADYGGVHWNSTVFSHWFYLLSQGGSDTNSEGVCYNISPIGITDAAKIVYLMETAYLTENSTFTDARTLSIYVATNLFGANSNQVVQTTNAWHAVGVGNVYQHYISGPNLICQPSSHDYSIENLTPGYTITWNPGPNVTRISPPGSNPCTFSFSGSGSKSIGATINSTCYSSQTIPQHNVWLGIPDFDYISGPNPPISYKGYTGQPYTFWTYPARDPDSQSSYQWMVVPPEYDWYFTYQYYDWATIVFNDPYDYYQVMCRATNTCGATNWQYKQVAIMQGYYFSMFPNPASDIVTVDLIGPTENIENLEKPFDFDVQILDYSGILHYSAKKSGDSFTIPVSNLKDGSYTVRITYGKEVENLPLIIKH